MQKAISITSLWNVMYSFCTLKIEAHVPSIFWYTHIKECVTFDPDTHFLRTYNLTKITNSVFYVFLWFVHALFQNCCVVLCIVCFLSFCVFFVCKCVLYFCHLVTTQLQLTNISYHNKSITIRTL